MMTQTYAQTQKTSSLDVCYFSCSPRVFKKENEIQVPSFGTLLRTNNWVAAITISVILIDVYLT